MSMLDQLAKSHMMYERKSIEQGARMVVHDERIGHLMTSQQAILQNQEDQRHQLNGVVGTLNSERKEQKDFRSKTGAEFEIVHVAVKEARKEVEGVKDVVQQLQQSNEQARKKTAKDRLFMRPQAALFNTKTGVYAWYPVRYTNSAGKTYKVVVLCMAVLMWYHKKGRPDAEISENDTRGYYGSDDAIPLHPEIPSDDFVAILEKTPFRPHQVSKADSWNRTNFLLSPLEAFKRVEQQNEKDYPNRPRTLPLKPKTKRSFVHLGNNIAYTQRAPNDLSSGYYLPFDRDYSMDEKAQVPAFGSSSVVETVDTSVIRNFFGVPEELRRKCHLVGGFPEKAVIKTHTQTYAEKQKDILVATKRRMDRVSKRNNSNGSGNKRKR